MTRWSFLATIWLLIVVVVAEETPPGLVATDTEHDLIAEASQTGAQAQKRDAGLSNSYGEPLPADAYGPPVNIPVVVPDLPPPPVYGVPESTVFFDTPPGAYGPPSPVVFPNQNYEGPPPPVSRPKQLYGPPKFHSPKQTYGPPKPVYGPPKKTYGPPKQSFPKPSYGAPLKPPKISFPKHNYGPPKHTYGAPKPIYGPPKVTYGTPLNSQSIPLQNVPLSPPQNFGSSTNLGDIGIGNGNIGVGTIGTQFGSLEASVGTSIGTNDLNFNLPAPVYGTPLLSLPLDLKPNFPIPTDTYGPPGHSLGPIGPNDQIVVQNIDNIGHYGPPQPDPNPQPPHPGIPAPPTPPHVLYDGWKPIPGISKPSFDNFNVNSLHSIESLAQHAGNIENLDQYGPPPVIQEVINVGGNSLPNEVNQNVHFLGPQVNTGYSSVHQDALANIDLNAIVGGDSNHIDQSKTIFEAHITDNNPNPDLGLIKPLPEKQIEVYSLPSSDTFSNGHYPLSFRQQGAKGLNPPSGVYGVPPGSQYGTPPKPPPANLPLPYGISSGGGHNGGPLPRHPIKFRDSVPEGLLQQIGHVSKQKDSHGLDHIKQGPAYIPPPIREIKDINQQTGNHGLSIQIEPSSLYSLPHSGNPISFQVQQPSNLYGSPIDSYAAPLLTVADHTASGSSKNEVRATIDGTILSNLSNLDAAAILKHCPYHEAILKAAQLGEKIPSDLASNYVASLSSLGSMLQKNQQSLVSFRNPFDSPFPENESVSYNTKDQSTASNTLVESISPNHIESAKNKAEKGQIIKDSYKQNIQQVSEQIHQTSEKIKTLSETTKNLQQKIESGNQIITQNRQPQFSQSEIPIKGNLASYSLQIQSANGDGKSNSPSIPHDQLLSEDLLQSILQAIEQPRTNQGPNKVEILQTQSRLNNQQYIVSGNSQNNDQSFGIPNIDLGGLVLPEGYEPMDRSKDNKPQKDQETQSSNTNIRQLLQNEAISKQKEIFTDCDLRPDNSITHTIVVPAPGVENVQRVDDIDDNEIAIYFGDNANDSKEEKPQDTVTEISVATSISEDSENKEGKPEFGDKIKKDS